MTGVSAICAYPLPSLVSRPIGGPNRSAKHTIRPGRETRIIKRETDLLSQKLPGCAHRVARVDVLGYTVWKTGRSL